MIAAEIIGQVLHAGGQIDADGADLVLTVPRPLPAELLDRLKIHKPAILAALAHPDDVALWVAHRHHRARRPYRRGRHPERLHPRRLASLR